MYIITGYNSFLAKNFLKKTSIKKNEIFKIKRNIKKLKKIKNKKVKIINFAAFYQKETYAKDILKVLDANLIYPARIVQILIEQNNKITFFNIASYFQLKENFKRKSNFYSNVKNAFIEILEYFEKKKYLNYYNIYLYDIFGDGDKRDKIFNHIIKKYKKNEVLNIQNPENLIAPISIIDTCKVINNYLLDNNRPNEIHINSGKIITLRQLCLIASSVLKKLRVNHSRNCSKDFLKIFKTKKYNINRNLSESLRNFFKKYV